ncbi:MAG: CD225/dispanin family protein [Bacteroidetes bacterium]|nr:CD225/dispanin family protein [Bacteroidota bacterium]MBS1629807.1 CD225/dispanin family protein [Bacteroidota bacterium]
MPTNPNGTIFINYRREDSNWNALALYNELQKYFSKEQLFKDFNAIRPGDDFVESIAGALQRCDVLLVLIGAKWLDAIDTTGKQRLTDPDDFVRLEIAKALSREIKVVPVMLDGAKMPRPEQLPEPLQSLTRRQLVEIDPTRFEDDVRKLAEAIRRILAEAGYPSNPGQPIPMPSPQQNPNPEPLQQAFGNIPPKPNNNLVWGILTTLLCCLPLGIVSIVQASKVDALYAQHKYSEAQKAADDAKKYALWAVGAGAVGWLIYAILVAIGAAQY